MDVSGSYKNATQVVLEDVCIAPLVIESNDLPSHAPSREDLALLDGEAKRQSERIESLQSLKTKRERELINLLERHSRHSDEDLEDAEIARKLNITRGNFYQIKSRLRKKSKVFLSEKHRSSHTG